MAPMNLPINDGSITQGFHKPRLSGRDGTATFHPDELASVMEKLRAILLSGEPGGAEARMRRFDGVYRWFLIRAEPLRDETGKVVRWYGISTDIEDRKQAEQKLRQDERELRRITDAIAQMIAVHDAGRRTDLCQPGHARLHGADHR